ncbi:DUF3618 domain-containing protein [Georgenia wangjunii]|uniref:DUF3618 domain-containing protein n=1 Tax=Georgenia wangjunii TaxID=3117730 RepID=UPI002F2687EF
MSTNDPDQIRADIERTRSALSNDVDALTDKVNPSNIAHRQTEKVKDTVAGVKDKVFGSASSASDSVRGTAGSFSDSAGSLAGSAKDAPHLAKRKAEGNPLAAGLIAFGVGLLVSSLIPSSEKERDIAEQAKSSQAVKDATEAAKSAAKESAEHLREPAQEAAQQLKESATESAERVKSEGTDAAGDVKDTAQQSKENVQDAR